MFDNRFYKVRVFLPKGKHDVRKLIDMGCPLNSEGNPRGSFNAEYNPVTKELRGYITEHFKTLEEANKFYGIYWIPNECNTDAEFESADYVFLEWDDIPFDQQQKKLAQLEARLGESTFVIKTSKSLHCYWKLDASITSAAVWSDTQSRLASMCGSDTTLKNPSRCMRLPGFDHLKWADDGSGELVRTPVTLIKETGLTVCYDRIDQQVPAYYGDFAFEKSPLGASLLDLANEGYLEHWDPNGRPHWGTCRCPNADNHPTGGESFDSLQICNSENSEHYGAFKCHSGCDPKVVYRTAIERAKGLGFVAPEVVRVTDSQSTLQKIVECYRMSTNLIERNIETEKLRKTLDIDTRTWKEILKFLDEYLGVGDLGYVATTIDNALDVEADPRGIFHDALADHLCVLAMDFDARAENFYPALFSVVSSLTADRFSIKATTTRTEPMIVNGVLIGETGEGKTPMNLSIIKSLSGLDDAEVERYQEELSHYEALPKHQKDEQEEPKDPRVHFITEFTVAGITALAENSNRGVLAWMDELGDLLGGNGHHQDPNTSLQKEILTLFNGTPSRQATRMRGAKGGVDGGAAKKIFPLIGGCQPEHLFQGSDTKGMFARFLCSRIERFGGLRQKNDLNKVDAPDTALVLEQLAEGLDQLEGAELSFTDEAWVVLEAYHNKLFVLRQQASLYKCLESYNQALPKIDTFSVRLSGLLHLINGVLSGEDFGDVISLETVQSAITLSEYFRSQALVCRLLENPDTAVYIAAAYSGDLGLPFSAIRRMTDLKISSVHLMDRIRYQASIGLGWVTDTRDENILLLRSNKDIKPLDRKVRRQLKYILGTESRYGKGCRFKKLKQFAENNNIDLEELKAMVNDGYKTEGAYVQPVTEEDINDGWEEQDEPDSDNSGGGWDPQDDPDSPDYSDDGFYSEEPEEDEWEVQEEPEETAFTHGEILTDFQHQQLIEDQLYYQSLESETKLDDGGEWEEQEPPEEDDEWEEQDEPDGMIIEIAKENIFAALSNPVLSWVPEWAHNRFPYKDERAQFSHPLDPRLKLETRTRTKKVKGKEVTKSYQFLDADMNGVDFNDPSLISKWDYDRNWKPEWELKPYETGAVRVCCDIEAAPQPEHLDNPKAALSHTTGFITAIGLSKSYGEDGEYKRTKFGIPTAPDNYLDAEREVLRQFFEYLVDAREVMADYHIIAGHNFFEYDLPFIWGRAVEHGAQLRDSLSRDAQYLITGAYRFDNSREFSAGVVRGNAPKYHNFIIPGWDVVDTLLRVAEFDKIASILSSCSLKVAPYELGLMDEGRVELNHKELTKCAYGDDGYTMDLLMDYLDDDLIATEVLLENFLPTMYYQLNIFPLGVQDLGLASPAKKFESVLEQYYQRLGWDLRPLETANKVDFEGGLGYLFPGFYRKSSELDFSSLYPSLICHYRLGLGWKDPHNHFLSIMHYARERLFTLKGMIKDALKAGDKKLAKFYKQQRQVSKVVANGGYGFTTTGGYKFNSYNAGVLTTALGRQLIFTVGEEVKKRGYPVIFAATDAVLYHNNGEDCDAQAVCQDINKLFPDMINLSVEFENMDTLQMGEKNYVVFEADGTPETIKGYLRKRNTPPYKKKAALGYGKQLVVGGEEAAEEYLEGLYADMVMGNYPVEEYVVKKKIGKAEKTLVELGIGEVGDQVQIYKTCKITKKPPTQVSCLAYFKEHLKGTMYDDGGEQRKLTQKAFKENAGGIKQKLIDDEVIPPIIKKDAEWASYNPDGDNNPWGEFYAEDLDSLMVKIKSIVAGEMPDNYDEKTGRYIYAG